MQLNLGIKHRVLMLAILPTIIISLFLGIYFTYSSIEELHSALISRGNAISSQLASKGEYGVFTNDHQALNRLIMQQLNDEVIGIAFINKEQLIIASSGVLPKKINISSMDITKGKNYTLIEEEKDNINFITPVTLPMIVLDDFNDTLTHIDDIEQQSTILGYVIVKLSTQNTLQQGYSEIKYSCLIVVLGLVISGFIAYRLGSNVTNPILELSKAVEKLKEGNLHAKAKTNAKWELATLESGINTMATTIHNAHKELQNNIDVATEHLTQSLQKIEKQNIELDMSRKVAQNAIHVKSEFLENVSHDLRTPLNGIVGFINLLQKTKLSQQQNEYVSIISKSSNNLLVIINDILNFSKIEAEKFRQDISKVDLARYLCDILTQLAPCAHEKNLELASLIYLDVPPVVMLDANKVKQVLTNLINNSITHTKQGSIIVRVMYEAHQANIYTIRFSVSDTGSGMTPKQKTKILEAFKNCKKTPLELKSEHLSLVMCKRIIDQMQGEIDLDTEENKGTTVWFTIQAQKVTPQELGNIKNQELKDIKVLVFDQHPIAKMHLLHTLESFGVRTQTASNITEIASSVKDAFEFGDPFQIAIIGINDFQDNRALLQNVIKNVKQPFLCPIGVTINTTDHLIHKEILNLGASLCLAKPLDHAKLFSALSNMFARQNSELPASYTIPDISILTVDDNKSNSHLVRVLLENMGVKVTVADSGEQAVDVAKTQIFNLILMDINMPKLNGIETAKIIRKHGKNIDTPIVALSAHILLNERKALAQAQINDYLTKPVNENQLKAIIYKWTQTGVSTDASVNINIKPMPKQVTTKDLATIDWSLAYKLAAGRKELAEEMMTLFVDTLPQEETAIIKAIDSGDYEELKNQAHRLHGACCYVGVPRLKQIAKDLEQAIILHSCTEIDKLSHKICAEIKEVYKSFAKYKATSPEHTV